MAKEMDLLLRQQMNSFVMCKSQNRCLPASHTEANKGYESATMNRLRPMNLFRSKSKALVKIKRRRICSSEGFEAAQGMANAQVKDATVSPNHPLPWTPKLDIPDNFGRRHFSHRPNVQWKKRSGNG